MADPFLQTNFKLPRHRKTCAYVTSKGKELCDCSAKFNGKPFAHWQRMAQKDVVETLVRALSIAESSAPYSLPAVLVVQQLLHLLESFSVDVVDEVNYDRERCVAGFAAIMRDICSGEWSPYFDPSAVGLPDNRDDSVS